MATRSKMMAGTPILVGDNSVPGLKIHKEVADVLPQIEAACKKMGLEYFPFIVEFVPYDVMAEIASYGGFPVRFPHWKWGMEYEELSRGYEFNQYRISEMVINTNPAIIYCMDSNTLVDNVDVIAHALGHNHFFKNNIFFEPTDTNMLNKLANHATRIRNYMARWGEEVVIEFIDHVMRIETLIDPSKAWKKKTIKQINVKDERKYHYPERLVSKHNYMDEWVNPKDFIDDQNDKIKKKEAKDYLDIFAGPEKDIFGYIKDHAPLKAWQQDVISMLYEESLYFSPQRLTKTINEGFASFVDHVVMCEQGLTALGQKTEDCGIWHYAKHKMMVLGGKYSQNPYKLGFELLLNIEDRWNKGKFGREWEECDDLRTRENWDKKLGLGRDKIFEVCKFNNDFTLIQEFFTPEFCEEKKFFEYRKFPNGEWKIVNRDFKSIKQKLLQRHLNGGLPDIRLVDPNHLGRGWFLLQHNYDNRPLFHTFACETLTSLYKLWNNIIVISTHSQDNQEYVYVCDGTNPEKNVNLLTRKEYEEFIKE